MGKIVDLLYRIGCWMDNVKPYGNCEALNKPEHLERMEKSNNDLQQFRRDYRVKNFNSEQESKRHVYNSKK